MSAEEQVFARAAAGGYAMVGPSGRTWSVDPATGVPVGPVSDAEHRMVRTLMQHERLDTTEPGWMRCADGYDEIVSRIVPVDPVDEARDAVDDVPADDDSDEIPGYGYPFGCCIPVDEDGWSR